MQQSPRSAVVIGAGFAGLGAAVKLRARGMDVTVLERADRPGGVWRDNDYPGSACDVPSFLYSYSFARKPDWTRRFAKQPEILDYIDQVVSDFDLSPVIRTGAEVASARFEESPTPRWTVTLASGEELVADMVVAACGQMSTPDLPALPGLDDFAGPVFHSARWDHEVDLTGLDVTVVGTGSSAIQFVPELARTAGSVTVLQRSPGYVVGKVDPEHDGPLPAWRHYLDRYRLFLTKELFSARLNHFPWMFAPVERRYRADLAAAVLDEDLRAKLSTSDRFGCKRLLVSNDWFRTLQEPHVHLHRAAAAHIEPTAVLTSTGERIETDVLVFGTGFRSTDFLHGIEVTGRGGTSLQERWKGGAGAYLGMLVPDFPNLFVLYGPNTNVGHNSILFMIEAQLRYLVRALDLVDRSGAATLEVRREVAEDFDVEMQRRSSRTVYATGCASWFTSATGKHTQNWPGSAIGYWLRTRRVRRVDHVLTPAGAGTAQEAVRAAR